MRTVFGHVVSVVRLSEASHLAGRVEDARQLAARALDLARAHKERGHQAWAHRLLGESLAQGDAVEVAQAAEHYRQARVLAGELGMRPLLAHCHLGFGTLYSQVGRREQARAELATAMALYRSMAMTFWLSRAETALVSMA
jgi:tetratricopeptide (TPR) repeat protein